MLADKKLVSDFAGSVRGMLHRTKAAFSNAAYQAKQSAQHTRGAPRHPPTLPQPASTPAVPSVPTSRQPHGSDDAVAEAEVEAGQQTKKQQQKRQKKKQSQKQRRKAQRKRAAASVASIPEDAHLLLAEAAAAACVIQSALGVADKWVSSRDVIACERRAADGLDMVNRLQKVVKHAADAAKVRACVVVSCVCVWGGGGGCDTVALWRSRVVVQRYSGTAIVFGAVCRQGGNGTSGWPVHTLHAVVVGCSSCRPASAPPSRQPCRHLWVPANSGPLICCCVSCRARAKSVPMQV